MVAADTIRSPIAKKSYLESKPAPTLEFNIKDWVSCQVTKSTPQETNIGLDFEYNPKDGNIYITKVYHLAHMFSDARVGDKLHKFFGKDAIEYSSKGEDGVKELYDIMKVETVISFETLHHEFFNESVTEISMDVEIGDIVPLQNYKSREEYNGHDVEVLRALKGNKYLVKVVANPKEKIIVHQDNLYYEVLVDQLVGKERTTEEDDGDSKQQSHHVLEQQEEASSEEASSVDAADAADDDVVDAADDDVDEETEVAEALEAVKFEEEEEERQRQLDEEHFQQYKSDMKTRMGC